MLKKIIILIVFGMILGLGPVNACDSCGCSILKGEKIQNKAADCKTCNKHMKKGGWCEKCRKGYVMSEVKCEECYNLKSNKADGHCKHCDKKFIKGKSVKEKYGNKAKKDSMMKHKEESINRVILRKAKKGEIGKKAVCPVMGSKIKVSEDTDVADYMGKSYFMCCSGCPEKFKNNPNKYIKK